MAGILVAGQNEDFVADLQNQLLRFVPQTQFVTDSPDIVIVDEDKDMYVDLRQKYPNVPIIFLKNGDEQKNDALNICLRKPIRLMQILDVVRAANHKLDHSTEGYLCFNGYELRPSHKEIADLQNNIVIKLTEKEIEIIKYLYKNAANDVSKAELQTNVWQYSEEVTTHTVETHIYRLRQKVETNNRRLIATDNGRYKLVTDEASDD
jgi:DNA-binding response OmpR family regulator